MKDSDVRCEMTVDGGWGVFQRRVGIANDFDRNMKEYKGEFGQLNGSFWLGLDKIHRLAACSEINACHFRIQKSIQCQLCN